MFVLIVVILSLNKLAAQTTKQNQGFLGEVLSHYNNLAFLQLGFSRELQNAKDSLEKSQVINKYKELSLIQISGIKFIKAKGDQIAFKEEVLKFCGVIFRKYEGDYFDEVRFSMDSSIARVG